MNRSLFVILAVLLVVSIFVTGCGGYGKSLAPIEDEDIAMWADNSSPYRIYPAYIKEVSIVIDTESLLPRYCLRVVAGGPNSCWEPWRYHVIRFGNMIFVKVLTLHDLRKPCLMMVTYVEKIIPLDSCLIPFTAYVGVVNGQWRLLAAGWWNGIKE